MAYTVQNCVDDVSFELRKRLLDGTGGTGADFNLIVRWIDQTSQDLLHLGLYRHMLRRTTTITSVAGTTSYAVTPTDIRRIEAVFDGPSKRFLSPLGELFNPSSLADVKDKPGAPRPQPAIADHRVSSPYPQYYWLVTVVTAGVNAHTLHIFPAPLAAENAGTITIYYAKQLVAVSGASTKLDVGDDGRDAMVAGVLARAYSYLHVEEKAQYWQQRYEALRTGETV